jgi:hypothetical protein
MGTPRLRPIAAALPDGRVLVAGGRNGPDYLASAEVFNPATGTFSAAGIGSMGTEREAAVAAPLPDGRVLVAGGSSGGPLSSAEAFDPATNGFSSAGVGSMVRKRDHGVAAPLPDGRVLIAGGYGNGYESSGEVFDPVTGSFSSAGIGPMAVARFDAAAAPLGDGRVLVAGGRDGALGERLASAEIFAATNTFGFRVRGKKLLVNVSATGTVDVSAAGGNRGASTAKKKGKRKATLRPSSVSGDPPTITVPLRLGKTAKSALKRRGKVKLRVQITFTPLGGIANTQTAKLKVKSGNRKRKK